MKHLLFISITSLYYSSATVPPFVSYSTPWRITPDGAPFSPSQYYDEAPSRAKRYVLRRKRWLGTRMTWRLLRNHITEADVYIIRNTLHRAFNDWAAVSNVHFEEIQEGESDLKISFERGFHEDRYPFDGRDGIVAHAFYPRDGRLHFDADEEWTLNQSNGVNLYQTALHEIGHLLGLEHSSDPRAAMYASKRPYSPVFTLSDDDVRAARELFPYGEREAARGEGKILPEGTSAPIPALSMTEAATTTLPESTTTLDPSTTVIASTSEAAEESTTSGVPETSESPEDEQTTESPTTAAESSSPHSTTSLSPMDRRPVFRLAPLFSTANRRVNTQSLQRSRWWSKRERVRSYSMLTLVDESTDLKKTSFFAQQAQPSSIHSFRL